MNRYFVYIPYCVSDTHHILFENIYLLYICHTNTCAYLDRVRIKHAYTTFADISLCSRTHIHSHTHITYMRDSCHRKLIDKLHSLVSYIV